MQLEEGKSYKTRNGNKAGPLVWWRDCFAGPVRPDDRESDRLFQPDGTHGSGAVRNIAALDIVAEWVDEPVPALSEGVKLDQAKPPLHLIAPDFLYAIADILDFGAKKYAPRNWEKGMDWSRVYRAAIGHLFDWFMRKGPDPETGKSHLWHAACCIMFLVCYEIRNTGTDDRP